MKPKPTNVTTVLRIGATFKHISSVSLCWYCNLSNIADPAEKAGIDEHQNALFILSTSGAMLIDPRRVILDVLLQVPANNNLC